MIMFRVSFLSLLTVTLVLFTLLKESRFCLDDDFRDIDIFQALGISGYKLQESGEIDKLDKILKGKFDSDEPGTNLDILLDELILDYKHKVPNESDSLEAKRLILSLRTLNGDNECNYYAYTILSNIHLACIRKVLKRSDKKLHRIDKILNHYINRHIENCRPIYFEKFDKIVSTNQNETLLKYLDALLGKAIHSAKITKQLGRLNKDDTEAENLYSMATNKVDRVFKFTSEFIYKVLKNLAKNDSDKEFIQPVSDTKTGLMTVRSDKFYRLYNDFIVKPCDQFREIFGPSLFTPIMFDGMFGRHQVQVARVDFYEAWLKYELCFGSFKRYFSRVLEFANHQIPDNQSMS